MFIFALAKYVDENDYEKMRVFERMLDETVKIKDSVQEFRILKILDLTSQLIDGNN